MKRISYLWTPVIVVLIASILFPGQVALGNVDTAGTLTEDDPQYMGEGPFYDEYTLEAQAGDEIVVDMRSDDFDTYILVTSPSGQEWQNDDYGSTSRSYLEAVADVDGTYTVIATSYSLGATGAYTIEASADTPEGVVTPFSGELADQTVDGATPSEHTFVAEAGSDVFVDIYSDEFDTYLTLHSPSGQTWSNDDYNGDTSHSRVEVTADESGEWTVVVTGFSPDASGSYTGQARVAEASGEVTVIPGSLTEESEIYEPRGTFCEEAVFQASAGDDVIVEMTSSEFDTYLIVQSPSGQEWSNDDYGSTSVSRVEFEADETGTYTIITTSYSSGSTGDYSTRVIIEAD
jgi:hypothetical protein